MRILFIGDIVGAPGRQIIHDRLADLVVQRNTNHAWHNLGDKPADFWGVMVSMLPVA